MVVEQAEITKNNLKILPTSQNIPRLSERFNKAFFLRRPIRKCMLFGVKIVIIFSGAVSV